MKLALPRFAQSLCGSAAIVGVVGLSLCAIGTFTDRTALFQSYLVAWWFFLGISLGSLVILMIHQLTGGAWGYLIRAPLVAAADTLPALALLFLPLAFGYRDLYAWANPGQSADTALLHAKSWYLNASFFWSRAIFYLLVWVALGLRLTRLLIQHSHEPRPELAARLRTTSVAGLIVYALTASFAAVDWIMSLTPQWYSTSFGLLTMLGQALSAFAFAIVGAAVLQHNGAATARARANQFHDLGNLLLMFVMTWAYLAYTQYLIIWGENLPREIVWYLPRTQTSWIWLGISLITFHFAVPFLLLLFRFAKRSAALLASLAGVLLFAHWIDALWLVVPSLRVEGFQLYWTDFAATFGVGGIWLAVLSWHLARSPSKISAALDGPQLHQPGIPHA